MKKYENENVRWASGVILIMKHLIVLYDTIRCDDSLPSRTENRRTAMTIIKGKTIVVKRRDENFN